MSTIGDQAGPLSVFIALDESRVEIERLTKELERCVAREEQNVFEAELQLKIVNLHAALREAEACMSVVEPRSDKVEYLRILGVVRAALGDNWSLPPRDPSG